MTIFQVTVSLEFSILRSQKPCKMIILCFYMHRQSPLHIKGVEAKNPWVSKHSSCRYLAFGDLIFKLKMVYDIILQKEKEEEKKKEKTVLKLHNKMVYDIILQKEKDEQCFSSLSQSINFLAFSLNALARFSANNFFFGLIWKGSETSPTNIISLPINGFY